MAAKHEVIIAIDPGRKKTGVAVCNTITKSARPLETIKGDLDQQLKRIAHICQQWRPTLIVVGLPCEKEANRANRYCKKMASLLNEQEKIETFFLDEAYTTQAARAEGVDSTGLDAKAASLLAEDWLANN